MRKLLYNAQLVNEGRSFVGYLAFDDSGLITEIGEGTCPDEIVFRYPDSEDLKGALLLPGAIDTHVHFREPGLTHKADIESESAAAVAGGVTTYFDMPNTSPATLTLDALEQKRQLAASKSHANYSFFIGASNTNLDVLRMLDSSRVPGIKVFLGSSTGNMLVDRENVLDEVFSLGKIVAVHAEDEQTIRENAARALEKYGEGNVPMNMHTEIRSREACVEATKKALERARHFGTRLHVCHVSTAEELDLINVEQNPDITAEACLLHLLFERRDFDRLGSRIKANPSVKETGDREALRQAVRDGRVATVATDHAPHLLSEKEGDGLRATSGAPMVQFSLPAMLDLAAEGCWSIETIVERMAHAPASLFQIEQRGFLRKGYYADLVIVRPEKWTLRQEDIVSKCGWSPMEGYQFGHRVVRTYVNGIPAYDNGTVDRDVNGMEVKFSSR